MPRGKAKYKNLSPGDIEDFSYSFGDWLKQILLIKKINTKTQLITLKIFCTPTGAINYDLYLGNTEKVIAKVVSFYGMIRELKNFFSQFSSLSEIASYSKKVSTDMRYEKAQKAKIGECDYHEYVTAALRHIKSSSSYKVSVAQIAEATKLHKSQVARYFYQPQIQIDLNRIKLIAGLYGITIPQLLELANRLYARDKAKEAAQKDWWWNQTK